MNCDFMGLDTPLKNFVVIRGLGDQDNGSATDQAKEMFCKLEGLVMKSHCHNNTFKISLVMI